MTRATVAAMRACRNCSSWPEALPYLSLHERAPAVERAGPAVSSAGVKTKEKFESVVKNAGGSVKLMEGYGLTEAVTAIMAMPLDQYR